MKFDHHEFWKHRDCMDVFIKIYGVPFDDDGRHATLTVCWMTQGQNGYWACSGIERLAIKPEQYGSWLPYFPRGEHRLY